MREVTDHDQYVAQYTAQAEPEPDPWATHECDSCLAPIGSIAAACHLWVCLDCWPACRSRQIVDAIVFYIEGPF